MGRSMLDEKLSSDFIEFKAVPCVKKKRKYKLDYKLQCRKLQDEDWSNNSTDLCRFTS